MDREVLVNLSVRTDFKWLKWRIFGRHSFERTHQINRSNKTDASANCSWRTLSRCGWKATDAWRSRFIATDPTSSPPTAGKRQKTTTPHQLMSRAAACHGNRAVTNNPAERAVAMRETWQRLSDSAQTDLCEQASDRFVRWSSFSSTRWSEHVADSSAVSMAR